VPVVASSMARFHLLMKFHASVPFFEWGPLDALERVLRDTLPAWCADARPWSGRPIIPDLVPNAPAVPTATASRHSGGVGLARSPACILARPAQSFGMCGPLLPPGLWRRPGRAVPARHHPEPNPRYNIAPTQQVLAVGLDKAGLRYTATFRWGSDPTLGVGREARADQRPLRDCGRQAHVPPDALRKRRCLIPASDFYEWRRQGKAKQPFAFRMSDDRPFAFAGIWEAWRPESAPPLMTCAILTTAANELTKPVHARMPVIVDPRHYDLWLDRACAGTGGAGPRAAALRGRPG